MKFNNTKIDFSKEVHIKIDNEEDYKYFLNYLFKKHNALYEWYITGRKRYEDRYKYIKINIQEFDIYRCRNLCNNQIFDVKELYRFTSLFKEFEKRFNNRI